MRILLLNQTFYPDQVATSQQVADLAEFLVQSGHEVTVLTGRRGYDDRTKIYAKQEVWNGVKVRRVNSTGLGKLTILRRVIDSVTFDLFLCWELLLTPKQDLVVSFTSPPLLGIFGTLFCLLKGGKCAQWLMDVNPDAAFAVGYVKRESFIGRILNAIFEFTIQKSDHLVVLDRWMKERMIGHGAVPGKISIVPPWAVFDVTKKEPLRSTGEFRKHNQLGSKFVVLYSGNHSVVHPLDTLLEAAYRFKDDTSIQFVFSGSGLRKKDVEKFVQTHGLKNVSQLPWQPREVLKDSFVSVDLHVVVMGNNVSGLVHPSKIYSVLLSGRPYVFIGPTKSHVVDLIQECPYGFHVEHGQVEKLCVTIKKAQALSEEEKRQIREQNMQHLYAHYGQERSFKTFTDEVVYGMAPGSNTRAPEKAYRISG